jgi:CRISPR type IV-associated protein Csf3
MQPLRITAELQSPVLDDGTLPIDAILYYTAMREKYGPETVTVSGPDHPEKVTAVSLPLARCEEHGPLWYYAASFAQWPEVRTQGSDYWNKRACDLPLTDVLDFGKKRGNVVDSRGRYKAYHMPIWYIHAHSVSWYVVGHRESIEALLRHHTNIGKKSSQGWGAVSRWTVEPMADDWSVRRDGKLARAIPAEHGVLTGFRPSYWMPKNQTVCEMPIVLR